MVGLAWFFFSHLLLWIDINSSKLILFVIHFSAPLLTWTMTFSGIIMTGMFKVFCFVYLGKKPPSENHFIFLFCSNEHSLCSNEQYKHFKQSPLFLPKQNKNTSLQIVRGRLGKVTFLLISESRYIFQLCWNMSNIFWTTVFLYTADVFLFCFNLYSK